MDKLLSILKTILFFFLSLLFRLVVTSRLWLYKKNILTSYKPSKFTVSIGNITVGGTGKTPFLAWCLGYCEKHNIKAAVLTRGYKSKAKQLRVLQCKEGDSLPDSSVYGDETAMLAYEYKQATFYISSNRRESAKLAEKTADIIFLDDGFQHKRVDRDYNIVLVHSKEKLNPFGLLPFGRLREPISELKRADCFVITKGELTSQLKKQLSQFQKPIYNSRFVAFQLGTLQNEVLPLLWLKNKKLILFSAIANPQDFEATMTRLGAKIETNFILPDHHSYTKKTICNIMNLQQKFPEAVFCCTEKDSVKLNLWSNKIDCYYIKMQFIPDIKLEEQFFSYFSHSQAK